MFITRTLKVASTFLLVGMAALGFSQEDKAQKYFLRSLTGDYRANIVVILKQQIHEESGTKTVKLQRSIDGKTKETVLAPLHLQGEYVDDGQEVKLYSPDQRLLIVQPSMSVALDNKFRLPLIQRNYTLKLEASKKVSGRNCVVVLAQARFNSVASIRYAFDEKTGFPLSKEMVHSDGSVDVEYEAADVSFPKRIDASVFKIDPVVGVEVVNYSEQKQVYGPVDAAKALGFTPIIPDKMPFGFQIQRMSVSSKNGVKILCLKLTDGLQRITIYEWVPAGRETIKTGEGRDVRIHNGLKIVAVSDIETGVRDSILRTFLVMSGREVPVLASRTGI